MNRTILFIFLITGISSFSSAQTNADIKPVLGKNIVILTAGRVHGDILVAVTNCIEENVAAVEYQGHISQSVAIPYSSWITNALQTKQELNRDGRVHQPALMMIDGKPARPGHIGDRLATTLSITDMAQAGRIVVVLAMPEVSTNSCLDAVFVTNTIVFIDLKALQPLPSGLNSTLRFKNRICKETIRGIAMSVGLEPCPFFRCALLPNQDEKDLDNKSINCCPACQGKLNDAMLMRGLPLPGSMR